VWLITTSEIYYEAKLENRSINLPLMRVKINMYSIIRKGKKFSRGYAGTAF
jgi:hypothetical protein